MERSLDFTLDAKFSALPDMIQDLHAHDQRYVMILVRACACVRGALLCSALMAVCAHRTQASAARSPRARTCPTRTG